MSDYTQHHDMCDLLSETAYITRVCTCVRAYEHDAEVRADEREKVSKELWDTFERHESMVSLSWIIEVIAGVKPVNEREFAAALGGGAE